VVEISLKGQVAVVTGGGRGIGRAIARSLARAEAAVAVAARTERDVQETAALIRREGGDALALPADVTDPAAVEKLVSETEQLLGPISLLVNNAGTCGAIGPIWQVDPEDWRKDVESSLLGAFLCARSVLPEMVGRRAGRIVNVSSYAAIRPTPNMSAYGCTKAALLHLTNSLAAEAEPYGVAVFAITPGRVRTGMTDYMLESPAGRRWLDMPRDEWLPANRAGELVVFLSSGRADVLSGRFIHVLDDAHELVRRAEAIRQDDLYVLRLRT
jgi:NAD(P)-dependent dehydrogenase (short-subunit alcohol dehydrogenase family)